MTLYTPDSDCFGMPGRLCIEMGDVDVQRLNAGNAIVQQISSILLGDQVRKLDRLKPVDSSHGESRIGQHQSRGLSLHHMKIIIWSGGVWLLMYSCQTSFDISTTRSSPNSLGPINASPSSVCITPYIPSVTGESSSLSNTVPSWIPRD